MIVFTIYLRGNEAVKGGPPLKMVAKYLSTWAERRTPPRSRESWLLWEWECVASKAEGFV